MAAMNFAPILTAHPTFIPEPEYQARRRLYRKEVELRTVEKQVGIAYSREAALQHQGQRVSRPPTPQRAETPTQKEVPRIAVKSSSRPTSSQLRRPIRVESPLPKSRPQTPLRPKSAGLKQWQPLRSTPLGACMRSPQAPKAEEVPRPERLLFLEAQPSSAAASTVQSLSGQADFDLEPISWAESPSPSSPSSPSCALDLWVKSIWRTFSEEGDESVDTVNRRCAKWIALNCRTRRGAFTSFQDLETACCRLSIGRDEHSARTVARGLWTQLAVDDALPVVMLLAAGSLHMNAYDRKNLDSSTLLDAGPSSASRSCSDHNKAQLEPADPADAADPAAPVYFTLKSSPTFQFCDLEFDVKEGMVDVAEYQQLLPPSPQQNLPSFAANVEGFTMVVEGTECTHLPDTESISHQESVRCYIRLLYLQFVQNHSLFQSVELPPHSNIQESHQDQHQDPMNIEDVSLSADVSRSEVVAVPEPCACSTTLMSEASMHALPATRPDTPAEPAETSPAAAEAISSPDSDIISVTVAGETALLSDQSTTSEQVLQTEEALTSQTLPEECLKWQPEIAPVDIDQGHAQAEDQAEVEDQTQAEEQLQAVQQAQAEEQAPEKSQAQAEDQLQAEEQAQAEGQTQTEAGSEADEAASEANKVASEPSPCTLKLTGGRRSIAFSGNVPSIPENEVHVMAEQKVEVEPKIPLKVLFELVRSELNEVEAPLTEHDEKVEKKPENSARAGRRIPAASLFSFVRLSHRADEPEQPRSSRKKTVKKASFHEVEQVEIPPDLPGCPDDISPPSVPRMGSKDRAAQLEDLKSDVQTKDEAHHSTIKAFTSAARPPEKENVRPSRNPFVRVQSWVCSFLRSKRIRASDEEG